MSVCPARTASSATRARHQADADLGAIMESGRGDVPLTELRFRCLQCGTDRLQAVSPRGVEALAGAT
jgi:hypothetical protein